MGINHHFQQDEDISYESNAEALVYLVSRNGKFQQKYLYVMRRIDAMRFLSDERTAGQDWMLVFTTTRKDWRDHLDKFVKDDGRFNDLLNTLRINPIYPQRLRQRRWTYTLKLWESKNRRWQEIQKLWQALCDNDEKVLGEMGWFNFTTFSDKEKGVVRFTTAGGQKMVGGFDIDGQPWAFEDEINKCPW